MLDGHSSHYTLELVQEALKNEVIIFCLPPHTTADIQPLDTSCFAPLKVHWSDACWDYIFKNPGRIVSKLQFSKLFASAWSKGLTIGNITSAFRNTGIYPLNREKILQKLPITASEDNSDHLSANGASLNAAQACESEIEHSHLLQSQHGPLTKQSCLKGDGKMVMTFTVILNMWLGYINSIPTVLLRYQQYFLLCHH